MQYYINMGRWADSIIGPFATHDEAEAYIATIHWRGAEPSVVTIAEPRPIERDYEITLQLEGTRFKTTQRATSEQAAVDIVHTNVCNTIARERWGYDVGGKRLLPSVRS